MVSGWSISTEGAKFKIKTHRGVLFVGIFVLPTSMSSQNHTNVVDVRGPSVVADSLEIVLSICHDTLLKSKPEAKKFAKHCLLSIIIHEGTLLLT